jgi:hypothetical protein
MGRPALIENVRVIPVRGEGHRRGDHVSEGEQAPAEQPATRPESAQDICASDRLDGLIVTLPGPPDCAIMQGQERPSPMDNGTYRIVGNARAMPLVERVG